MAAHWAIGVFLTCVSCAGVDEAGRVWDFDLFQELSGRGKKISATLYMHAERVKVKSTGILR